MNHKDRRGPPTSKPELPCAQSAAGASEFAAVFAQAVRHHQAGELREAERLYRDILARDPDKYQVPEFSRPHRASVGPQRCRARTHRPGARARRAHGRGALQSRFGAAGSRPKCRNARALRARGRAQAGLRRRHDESRQRLQGSRPARRTPSRATSACWRCSPRRASPITTSPTCSRSRGSWSRP